MEERLNNATTNTIFVRVTLVALVLITTASLGCDQRPRTYPVSGKVTFADGKPIHTGTIELKERETGINARGEIKQDGTFTLSTFDSNDGAVVGMHDCVVIQRVIVEDLKDFHSSTYGVIDPRHNSYHSSGLQVEVLPINQNQVTLVVERLRKDWAGANEKHVHEQPLPK
jgi:hypothetical protein